MECEYDRRKKCDSLYIERYNKLLKENEELKSIIKTKDEGITAFIEDLCDTTKELEKTKSIINKAIEYIEDRFFINEETGEYYLTHTFDDSNLYELMKILDKGV